MAPTLYERPVTVRQYGMDKDTQDEILEKRLSEFTWDNPLGISPYLHLFVTVYAPSMVSLGIGMNLFAMWVLESPFIRDLVVQPLLSLLLRLNSLLLFCGPLYMWLVQTCGLYITGDQIFHCFLLNMAHNFTLFSSAFILTAIVMERGLAIGRSKSTWNMWRKVCANTGTTLLQASLLLSLSELLHMDAQTVASHKNYPLCMPWWENEHGPPKWYKMMAVIFSLGPTLVIIVFILLLELCTAKFSLMSRLVQDSLTDYQSLLVELTNTVHFKFSSSASCLGIVFIILCSPVGFFITLGPVLHVRTSWMTTSSLEGRAPLPVLNLSLPNGSDPASQLHLFLGNDTLNASGTYLPPTHGDVFSTVAAPSTAGPEVTTRWGRMLSPLEYRYALISRGDSETVIWLMRYTFCALAVPILLATEVLFVREWKGRVRQATSCLLLRRRKKDSKWASLEGAPWKTDINERARGHGPRQNSMAGPYIARIDGDDDHGDNYTVDGSDEPGGRWEHTGGKRGNAGRASKPDRKLREMKVFDASKPARAGRKVEKLDIKRRRPVTRSRADHHRDGGIFFPIFQAIQNGISGVFRRGARSSSEADPHDRPHHRAQMQEAGGGFARPSSRNDDHHGYSESLSTTEELTGGGACVASPTSSTAAAAAAVSDVQRGKAKTSRGDGNLPPKRGGGGGGGGGGGAAGVRAKNASTRVTEAAAQQPPDFQLLAQLAAVSVRRRDFLNTVSAPSELPTTSTAKAGNALPAASRAPQHTPQPQKKVNTRKSPKAASNAGKSENIL